MIRTIPEILASELNTDIRYIENIIKLIDEGNTIPFIARYRKEMHGGMNDTDLRTLEDRLNYLTNLQKRRDEVKHSITEQGKMTDELNAAIDNASTLSEVEDIYRPYKQKKRTRASVAREKGLEPLAELIIKQEPGSDSLETIALGYVDPEKELNDVNSVLAGAGDIIAEDISDSAEARKKLKESIIRMGTLDTKAATEEDSVYRIYYDFSQPIHKVHGYQVLAINRGEKEGFLKSAIAIDERITLSVLYRMFIKKNSCYESFLTHVVDDSYNRLLFPSLEREFMSMLTDAANEGAIKNFAINLKPLLLQAPVKGKVTLGYDPGYRNGCKLAVVDPTGRVLDTAVIYPTQPYNKVEESKKKLSQLITKHHIENIAIGNGTASRESEQLVAEVIKDHKGVSYCIVNESGASVYSASKLAAEEFPDYDVNLRSAVSIARRLQDPLAELVKIEPKAIGVGQYQHDMPQKRLSDTLTGVVEDCVNAVGAELNTASASLLSYISGLSKTTAKNIVLYREANGKFTNRKQLLKVPKLGPKAFEQCAGFIRISDGADILDRTGVHPESYNAACELLELCGYSLQDVANGKLTELSKKVSAYGEDELASKIGVGKPTLADIIRELLKPGRDMRDELPPPILRSDVLEIKDLKPGMILNGTVRNVIDFGAFVDIGVHQDGLVHISEVCEKFIKHPSEILSVGDIVSVKVLEVDVKKHRIGLSIKQANV